MCVVKDTRTNLSESSQPRFNSIVKFPGREHVSIITWNILFTKIARSEYRTSVDMPVRNSGPIWRSYENLADGLPLLHQHNWGFKILVSSREIKLNKNAFYKFIRIRFIEAICCRHSFYKNKLQLLASNIICSTFK